MKYATRFVPVAALDSDLQRRMAALYLDNYDATSDALFLADLARKDEALLVETDDELVGFTTLRVYDRCWNGHPIRVVYSGDTIVHPRHWGQQALAFAWIARTGTLKRERPDVPLYWLLLVKGHRTFRYLPVFGRSFYPHWSSNRWDLKPLADILAGEMFPDAYNPITGVVEFAESRGQLKPHIALPSSDELSREGVEFFLSRNPGFTRGHELVCVCEIDAHNMKPLTRRVFERGARAS